MTQTLRIIAAFFLITIFTVNSYAAEKSAPGQFLMDRISEMILVLENQNFKNDQDKQIFQQKILNFLAIHFDWDKITRKSLGEHWNSFTPKQQQIFTAMFRGLIENFVLSSAPFYNGQTINLVSDTTNNVYAKIS